jgi:hypothetical protein
VHQGKPYADKPRLFLQEADFVLEDENAFLIVGNTIRRRERGRQATLTVRNGSIVFENEYVRASLSANWEASELELKRAFEGTVSLTEAAEMGVILQGVTSSLGFVLTD